MIRFLRRLTALVRPWAEREHLNLTTETPPAPPVIVSQAYRDEQAEMEAAEGHFVFDAPQPRPIEEQRAFDLAAERDLGVRAMGNGCYESPETYAPHDYSRPLDPATLAQRQAIVDLQARSARAYSGRRGGR